MNASYNARTYKSILTSLSIDMPFLCGGYYFSPGDYWCYAVKYTYAKGLGKVLEENVNPYATRICIWNMSYFKKGTETWGTPFLFYQAVNTGDVEKNQLQIIPNPTTGKLTISDDGFAITTITIFNLLGKKIDSWQFAKSGSEIQIDIGGLSPGIYIIQATSGEKTWRGKVVNESTE